VVTSRVVFGFFGFDAVLAHLLLQIRTRVLNDTLADDYRRWYPGFTHTGRQDQAA
jgi:hypothetical protein